MHIKQDICFWNSMSLPAIYSGCRALVANLNLKLDSDLTKNNDTLCKSL